tara:strand:+ start:401 stop:736 length:336 start_codon:yes stop_codon:yes gene_type:complete
MGWAPGSRQVKTYVHLCPKDVEQAFLKMHGLTEEEKQKNLPQTCGCGMINDSFARYCLTCGNPLRVEIVMQDQEMLHSETNKAVREMMEMFKDPRMLKQFEEFKNGLGDRG